MKRFFKLRKWMFLAAFLVTASKSGWIDFEEINNLLSFVHIPETYYMTAIWWVGSYFLVMGVLICFQIGSTSLQSWLERSQIPIAEEAEFYNQGIDRLGEETKQSEDVEKRRPKIKLYALSKYWADVQDGHASTQKIIFGTEVMLDVLRVAPPLVILFFSLLP